jgi:ABC-type phosphate/phosphonate transport system permease subunit
MADSSNSPGSEPSGLKLKKFNSTSVTTTTDVITPKLSSADKSRRVAMVAIVIVALAFLGAMAFRTSGFNPFEKTAEHGGFARPEPNLPQ